jgi:single-strand DNA-binding protein
MSSFNKVLLMGNLTRDPAFKQLPNNSVVADFGLACTRRYRTASGEDREETAFVDCSAFGRQAEVINQFCRKGKPLFIEGRLKYETWDDKQNGDRRSKLSVVVENFQFVGGRDPNAAPGSTEASPTDRHGRTDPQSPAAPARPKRTKTAQLPFDKEKHFEEADIPF